MKRKTSQVSAIVIFDEIVCYLSFLLLLFSADALFSRPLLFI